MLQMDTGWVNWGVYIKGYAPTKTLSNGLDPELAAGLMCDFLTTHYPHHAAAGLATPLDYGLTLGARGNAVSPRPGKAFGGAHKGCDSGGIGPPRHGDQSDAAFNDRVDQRALQQARQRH